MVTGIAALRLSLAVVWAASAWGVADAAAQTAAGSNSSLLSPNIDGGAQNAQRFQPASGPVPPGTGQSGFVSTNLPPQPAAADQRPSTSFVSQPRPRPASGQTALAGTPLRGALTTGTAAELLPVRPRPRRPVDQDPFEPLGLRMGSFTVKPAIDLSTAYDTNPRRIRNGQSSFASVAAAEVSVQSDWSRHALSADLRGSYSAYSKTTDLNRPYVNGRVNGRIDVSRQTSLDLEGRMVVTTDNPGSPDIQANLAYLPIYTSPGASAGVTQRFNRVVLSAKGDFDRISYADSVFTNGQVSSNADRNYDRFGYRFRAGYETLPGVVPFIEYAGDRRIYDRMTDRYGQQRDSMGTTVRGGLAFDLPERLKGDISAGYSSRDYQEPSLPPLAGFVFDASLVWTATPLTTVTLAGTSTINEVTLPGLTGYLSRDVGVQVDHAFRQWLIGFARVGIGFDTYQGIRRDDERQLLAAGMTYKLSRSMQLKGELRRETRRSNMRSNDYTANVATIGVRLQR